jgi:hypothetical protein
MVRAAHTRITWTGTFGPLAGPVETWQTSLLTAWASGDGPQDVDAATITGQANSLYNAFKSTIIPIMGGQITLRSCSYRRYDGTGHEAKGLQGQYVFRGDSTLGPDSGLGAATPIYPTSAALVVSLQSAKAGSRGKGRCFLPMPPYALATDHRITPTQQTNAGDAAVAWINAVNAIVGAEGKVAVFSSDGTAGAGCRRRGDMLEAYTTRTVA